MEYLITHSAMCHPEHLSEFLEGIPLRFMHPLCARVLEIVGLLQDQGRLVSLETLSLELGEASSSIEFLKILERTPVLDYLALKEEFKRYLLIKAQRELSAKLAKASDHGEIFDLEFISNYAQVQLEAKFRTLAYYFEMLESQQIKPLAKIPTGLDFIDEGLEGGVALAQLVLISGDKDAGKTMLALQMLEGALIAGYKVCYFCYEFSLKSYVLDVKKRGFKQNPNFYYLEGEFISLEDVCFKVRALALKHAVKFFVIDSQQSLGIPSPYENNPESLETQKFIKLGALCMSLEIIVVLIIQTAKADPHSPLGTKRGGHLAHLWFSLEITGQKDKRVNHPPAKDGWASCFNDP